MDYPHWFVDVKIYEPGEGDVELVEMLLDMKVNMKQRRRVDKEGVFAYISINDSHTNIYKHVEAGIISFPTFFFGVHPLRMTTTSSSTLKVGITVAEGANA